MNLPVYHLGLNVDNIAVSKTFYEKLGYSAMEGLGSIEDRWLVMQQNGQYLALYQDMFPRNLITFQPKDARMIYHKLKSKGISIAMEAHIGKESGPCHFSIIDPDGNPILFDQME
ncbi:MAG: VOC family protein [Saprospiraceae bacterium]|nr:VOC family protein [Saprospiraceae bacterium]